MILREKREIQGQSPFFLENIKFWKSLPQAPNFKWLLCHAMGLECTKTNDHKINIVSKP